MGKPFIPPKKRVLSLRPEQRKAAEVSIQSREKIDEFVKKTRNPFGGDQRVIEKREVDDVERTLRKLEKELLERERQVTELESRVTEKQREVWEAEALLEARQKVFDTQKTQMAEVTGAAPVSNEERKALEGLKQEIEQREKSLEETRQLMKERESFIEEAEARLFEKTMEQQEREAEFEIRADELEVREARLDQREGIERPKEPTEVLE